MANMGHCRFQNTLADLRDCYDHIDDKLSDVEAEAQKALVALCAEIADDFREDDDD